MDLTNSLFVEPQNQRLVATPSDFCLHDFGLNNPDLPVEAVRLSRVINKLTDAFQENDTILDGFSFSNFKYNYDSKGVARLTFDLSHGEAVIDNTIVTLPNNINCEIVSPDKAVPISAQEGRMVIYIFFNYSSENNIDRPIRQNHERYLINYYPLEQYTFNPYRISWSLYDPKTKNLVYDPWKYEDHVIILTSHIYYARNKQNPSRYDFWYVENDNSDLVSDFGNQEKIYEGAQEGGYQSHIEIIDGGDINEVTDVVIPPTGINSIYSGEIRYNTNTVSDLIFTNKNDSYVFYNGVCYSEACSDYSIQNNTTVVFQNPRMLETRSVLQIFETLKSPSSGFGYLKGILNTTISSSILDLEKHAININTISPSKNYLVIVNGITQQKNIDYTLATNQVIFRSHVQLTTGESIIIIQIVEGTLPDNQYKLKIMYDDVAINSTKKQNIYGLNSEYSYMVFYNGLLYRANSDYTITTNMIEFRRINMVAGNSLIIIQI